MAKLRLLRLSDWDLLPLDALQQSSVVMHLVVTDPNQTTAEGGVLPSVPLTIYKLFMYDDGADARDTPSAPFGSRYLPNTTYVYNDADALSVEGQITPDIGGLRYPG